MGFFKRSWDSLSFNRMKRARQAYHDAEQELQNSSIRLDIASERLSDRTRRAEMIDSRAKQALEQLQRIAEKDKAHG